MLTEQFICLLGGGGTYTGRDIRSARKDMGVQTADFAAVVDNLQRAMTRNRVPFAAQNRLLAKTRADEAPGHRTVSDGPFG